MDQGKEVINQPAGHWEPGETLPQAAIRETLEETAWEVELTGLIGVFLSSSAQGEHYCRVAFTANALRHDSNTAIDEDILAVEWLSRMNYKHSVIKCAASWYCKPCRLGWTVNFLI